MADIVEEFNNILSSNRVNDLSANKLARAATAIELADKDVQPDDVASIWSANKQTIKERLQSGTPYKQIENEIKEGFLAKRVKEAQDTILEAAKSADPETRSLVVQNIRGFEQFVADSAEEVNTLLDTSSVAPLALAAPNATEIKQQYEANKAFALELASSQFEDQGIVGDAVDVVSYLVPDSRKDYIDLAGKLGFSNDVELTRWFLSQTPEEQRLILPQLVEKINEAFDGNKFKTIAAVERLFDKDVELWSAIDTVFDAVDVADIGLAFKGVKALSLAKSLRGRGTLIRKSDIIDQAAEVGNYEKAADLNVAAATKPEAAQFAGRKVEDAMYEFDPTADTLGPLGLRTNSIADKVVLKDVARNSAEQAFVNEVRKTEALKEIDVLTRTIDKFESNSSAIDVAIKAAREAAKKNTNNKEALKAIADLAKKKRNIDKSIDVLKKRLGEREKFVKRHSVLRNKDEAVEAVAKQNEAVVDNAKASIEKTAEALRKSEKGEKVAQKLKDNPEKYGINPHIAEELYRRVVSGVEEAANVVKKNVAGIVSENRARVREATIRKLNAALANEQNAAMSVKYVGDTKDGTGFIVEVKTNKGVKKKRYSYVQNRAGTFDGILEKANEPVLRGFWKDLLTPETLFNIVDKNLVEDFTFIENQVAIVKKALRNSFMDTLRGLSRSEREAVISLIKQGDAEGKVYKASDLFAGNVATDIGRRAFNEKEVEAYYKMRFLLDELHTLYDESIARELVQKGYARYSFEGEDYIFAARLERKPDDLTADAMVMVPGEKPRFIPAVAANKLVEKGYKWRKMIEPIWLSKKQKNVKYALIPDSVEGERITSGVLKYREGYAPRVYKPEYVYIKEIVDGRAVTRYIAKTPEEADKFLKLPENANKEWLKVRDGDLTPEERLVHAAEQLGGFARKTRAMEPPKLIDKDMELTEAEALPVVDSIQLYTNVLSKHIALGEYRANQLNKWAATVEELAKRQNKAGILDRESIFSDSPMIDLDAGHKELMLALHKYIRVQSGMGTDRSRWFSAMAMRLGDKLFGKTASERLRQAIVGISQSDPVSKLRAYAFNAQMGMFNVRQFFIQALNATNALAMHPVHGAKALADALPMRMAVLSGDEKVWRKAAKFSTMAEDEFVKLVRKFRESGLYESITDIADYAPTSSFIDSKAADVTKRAMAAGRVFFTEGELFSRLVTFNVARRALGKGASTKKLVEETLRMALNLQQANAATWQKGALGIPLMYMQVFAKFAEKIIPALLFNKGSWTRKEAASVIGFQLVMFGPDSDTFTNDIKAAYLAATGKQEEQLTEEEKRGLREGAMGYILAMLGVDAVVSDQASLLTGLVDNPVTDLLKAIVDGATGEASDEEVYRLLLGAPGSTITRTVDVVTESIPRTIGVIVASPTPDTVARAAVELAEDVASITSAWSNAEKALLYKRVGIISKRGTLITGPIEMNPQTTLAVAMGFSPKEQDEYYRIKDINATNRRLKAKVRQRLKKAVVRLIETGDKNYFEKEKAIWLSAYESDYAREQVMKDVLKEMIEGKELDKETRAMIRAYIIYGGDLTAFAKEKVGE